MHILQSTLKGVVTLIFCMGAPLVYGADASVSNQVYIHTNTGGNVVSPGGQIQNGHSNVNVDIETTVDRETQTSVHIATSSNSSINLRIQNGANGEDGADGANGRNEVRGSDGKDGTNGASAATAAEIISHSNPSVVTPVFTEGTTSEETEDAVSAEANNDLQAYNASAASFPLVIKEYIQHIFTSITGYVAHFFSRK